MHHLRRFIIRQVGSKIVQLCLHAGSIKICMHGRFQSSNKNSSSLIEYFPVLTYTLKVLLRGSLKVSQVHNKTGQHWKTKTERLEVMEVPFFTSGDSFLALTPANS